ncbi:MAG: (2Fe-2S)-binding protein [Deltaproteobacteria bacterium]
MRVPIQIEVNQAGYSLEVEPRSTLLELLRETLHLTGTKEGCGQGDCGTCIVLLDGIPVNACLMLAVDAQGRQVTTIEGLAMDGKLHPLQKSFIEKGAIQCGFCTPAMVLSAKARLDKKPRASREEIKQALSGVLCRCGSYQKILEAVQAVSEGIDDGA